MRSWISLSVSQAKTNSLRLAGVVSLWILRGCLGGRSLPTERTFLEKRLSSTIHSPQTKLCTGTRFLSHPGILSDPISLLFPRKQRFLLKHQTRCIKNCCTSCFFFSCRFQNTSLKGARTILPPTSFKCKRRTQSIAETKLKSKISLASKGLAAI